MSVVLAGRYELLEVIGTGGMSTVRKAHDTVLDRHVAVKLFRDDLDDASALRVRQEMQTLASLSHPCLVSVHDAGTADGQPYLVMELVPGPTLGATCPLPVERLAVIGAQVAEALAYVHDRGVVHRDVKPANVLLTDDGAKLADFGVARIVDGARHTGTGLTIGTAPYLSPEQVTGLPVGPPADVYALGLVLLECLTGHREYDGSAVESAMARLHRPPAVPLDLPAPWPELLLAMTARAPEHRPTAAEVAITLRGEDPYVAAPPPTAVLPVDPPEEPLTTALAVEPRQRSVTPLLVIAGALVVLLVVLAAVLGSGGDPPAAPTRLEQHVQQLQDAVDS